MISISFQLSIFLSRFFILRYVSSLLCFRYIFIVIYDRHFQAHRAGFDYFHFEAIDSFIFFAFFRLGHYFSFFFVFEEI